MDDCPKPTFISLYDDGALHLTWCFGGQGETGSYRIMFVWDPNEGPMAAKIVKDGELTSDMTDTAGLTLVRLLSKALTPTRTTAPERK